MGRTDRIRPDKGWAPLTNKDDAPLERIFHKPGKAIRIGGARERGSALFTLVSKIDQQQHALFDHPRADAMCLSARWNSGYLFRGNRTAKGFYEINYAGCPDDLTQHVETTLTEAVATAVSQDQNSGHSRIGGKRSNVDAGWLR